MPEETNYISSLPTTMEITEIRINVDNRLCKSMMAFRFLKRMHKKKKERHQSFHYICLFIFLLHFQLSIPLAEHPLKINLIC